jgi:hypothetical protein
MSHAAPPRPRSSAMPATPRFVVRIMDAGVATSRSILRASNAEPPFQRRSPGHPGAATPSAVVANIMRNNNVMFHVLYYTSNTLVGTGPLVPACKGL